MKKALIATIIIFSLVSCTKETPQKKAVPLEINLHGVTQDGKEVKLTGNRF